MIKKNPIFFSGHCATQPSNSQTSLGPITVTVTQFRILFVRNLTMVTEILSLSGDAGNKLHWWFWLTRFFMRITQGMITLWKLYENDINDLSRSFKLIWFHRPYFKQVIVLWTSTTAYGDGSVGLYRGFGNLQVLQRFSDRLLFIKVVFLFLPAPLVLIVLERDLSPSPLRV